MIAVFFVAMTSSPGGRARLGLAAREAPNAIVQASALPPPHVVDIVSSRCAMCHAPEPVWDGIQIAPKGVMLDTPERVAARAVEIRMQAVLTHAMPPNNITEISPDERRQLAAWLDKQDRAAP
jgi:uncharacterized membrane protein